MSSAVASTSFPLARRSLSCSFRCCLLLSALLGGISMMTACASTISGVVWQPENAVIDPKGKWDQIGARQLLIQWTAVDNLAFVSGAGIPTVPKLPDWPRIATEPWAKEVILGLAGYFDETKARANLDELGALSERLAKLPTPLNVVGWYFPVEIDPTWGDAPKLAAILNLSLIHI